MTQESSSFPQRFDAAPYRPDGVVPFGGLVVTIALTFGAAIAIGALVSFIHQWFYLIAIFPALMGLGVGFAGTLGVSFGKIRSSAIAGLVGITAGILVMLVSHYGEYLREISQMPQELRGQMSFTTFVDFRAQQGVTISRMGRGQDKGLNLGYIGSYLYWLAEMAIAAGVAWYMMKQSAVGPFCTPCNTWKGEEVLGALNIDPYSVTEIVSQGDLLRLMATDLPTGNPVVFTAHACSQCGDQSTLEVSIKEITTNKKGEKKEKQLGTWSFAGNTLPAWQSVFAQPEPEPAEGGEALPG